MQFTAAAFAHGTIGTAALRVEQGMWKNIKERFKQGYQEIKDGYGKGRITDKFKQLTQFNQQQQPTPHQQQPSLQQQQPTPQQQQQTEDPPNKKHKRFFLSKLFGYMNDLQSRKEDKYNNMGTGKLSAMFYRWIEQERTLHEEIPDYDGKYLTDEQKQEVSQWLDSLRADHPAHVFFGSLIPEEETQQLKELFKDFLTSPEFCLVAPLPVWATVAEVLFQAGSPIVKKVWQLRQQREALLNKHNLPHNPVFLEARLQGMVSNGMAFNAADVRQQLQDLETSFNQDELKDAMETFLKKAVEEGAIDVLREIS